MSGTSSAAYTTGRPNGPEYPAARVLERFEELARTKRRAGRPALPNRHELAEDFGRTEASVRNWCRPDKYNLPWPFFHLDEPACLIDALPPRYEILYVNTAMCDLLHWTREELRFQPSRVIRPSEPHTPDELERRILAQALKNGDRESGWLDTWLCTHEGDHVNVRAEMRYGKASDAFYVRMNPLQVAPKPERTRNVVAEYYIDASGKRHSGRPPSVRSVN